MTADPADARIQSNIILADSSMQQNASHTIGEEFYGIVAFMGVIWAVFLLTCAVPSLDAYGVVPPHIRRFGGHSGHGFLHANLHHLLANTIPLLILLALLAGSKARSWEIVIDVKLFGGLLLWLVGRSATHIGASGLIFGLISFLILSGFLEKRIRTTHGLACGGFSLWRLVALGNHAPDRFARLLGRTPRVATAGGIVAYALTRRVLEASAKRAGNKAVKRLV